MNDEIERRLKHLQATVDAIFQLVMVGFGILVADNWYNSWKQYPMIGAAIGLLFVIGAAYLIAKRAARISN